MMDTFDFEHAFDYEGITLTVKTRTQGWHEAAIVGADPDRCHDDEGESETEITEIVLTVGTHEIKLPALFPDLFDLLVGYLQGDADAAAEARLETDWHAITGEASRERDIEDAEWRKPT